MRNFLTASVVIIGTFCCSPVHAYLTNHHVLSKRFPIRSPLSTANAAQSAAIDPVADEVHGWSDEFPSVFLRKYWQRKPVLIRQALDVSKVLKIGGSELVSLALEEDVETRLIYRKGEKWKKQYGPFESERFQALPKGNWTILVQEVDRHIPSIADIWNNYFNFIPSWRRDDVMISYATPDGGIGAHVDSYDVFLIQGR